MVQRVRRRVAVCGFIIVVALGARSAHGQIPEWFGSYRTAADFELQDVCSGRAVKLSDYFDPGKPTKNVVVLVFTGVSCPIGAGVTAA